MRTGVQYGEYNDSQLLALVPHGESVYPIAIAIVYTVGTV